MRNAPRADIFSSIALIGLLAGCSVYGPEPTIRGVKDPTTGVAVPGIAYINSGDQGSGKILGAFLQPDLARGGYAVLYGADGPGTFQTFTEGGLNGLFVGAGIAGGQALRRPDNFVSSVSNTSTSAGSTATGGTASALGGSASALGGAASAAGGAGGSGGVSSSHSAGGSVGPISVHQGQAQIQGQSSTNVNYNSNSASAAAAASAAASATGGTGGTSCHGNCAPHIIH